MCDYAEVEISSLESVFPESFVYLCDFHREQSWERWLSATHNGMTTQKSEVLELLRAIAKATTEDEFLTSVSTLKESSLWMRNQRIQNWLEKKWLKCYKRWVRAYRQERFNVSVNTNNGIERQNLALKYEYLDMKKARSLSQLLSILINKFLPDSYTSMWKHRMTGTVAGLSLDDVNIDLAIQTTDGVYDDFVVDRQIFLAALPTIDFEDDRVSHKLASFLCDRRHKRRRDLINGVL